MNIETFVQVGKLLEKLGDNVEDFSVEPKNEQYELNTNWKPCRTIHMEFYLPNDMEGLDSYIDAFRQLGFYVRQSEMSDYLIFFMLEW